MSKGWIGVDLDGTLAEYDEWKGPEHIGIPIAPMLRKVKVWLAHGETVKIFTARVSSNNPEREASLKAIKEWCLQYIGQELEVTAEKDYFMIEMWDDRCIQVIPNREIPLKQIMREAIRVLEEGLDEL